LRKDDLVYDLGAGTGAITEELLHHGVRVIAVEQDPNLARKLRHRFPEPPVTVLEQDLTQVSFVVPFKVVANIPFNVTAATLRRLLFSDTCPREALLVLQREAARKYSGTPRATEVSLRAAPWFELSIVYTFRPTDFVPAPTVDVVALRIRQYAKPLLSTIHRSAWFSFVGYAFGRTKPTLRLALKPVFSNLQWRLLASDLGFDVDASVTELSLAQWLGLFSFFLVSVPPHKRNLVFRA